MPFRSRTEKLNELIKLYNYLDDESSPDWAVVKTFVFEEIATLSRDIMDITITNRKSKYAYDVADIIMEFDIELFESHIKYILTKKLEDVGFNCCQIIRCVLDFPSSLQVNIALTIITDWIEKKRHVYRAGILRRELSEYDVQDYDEFIDRLANIKRRESTNANADISPS